MSTQPDGYTCECCVNILKRESNFLKHRCKEMIRAEELKSVKGQAAYELYSYWLSNKKKGKHTLNTFGQSKFFSTFYKFVTWSNTNKRKQKFNRCMVVPTNGDTSGCIQACLDNKDKNGESRCNAINIVLLKNPSIVVFQNDVNIPWHTNCVQSTVEKDAAGREDALVCYGVWQPDSPEVGNPWISSDDLRDAVFLSKLQIKRQL